MFWNKSNNTKTNYLQDIGTLQKDVQRLLISQEIIKKVSNKNNLEEISIEVLNQIEKKMGYSGASISLVDTEKNTIQLKYVSESLLSTASKKLGFLDKESFRVIPLTEQPITLTKKAAIENKIIIDRDLTKFTAPPMTKRKAQITKMVSRSKGMIAIPIRTKDRVIGVLNFVIQDDPDQITRNELLTLEGLMDQIGLVIDNILKYEEIQNFNIQLKEEIKLATEDLRKQNAQLQSLYDLSTSISATLDPDVVVQSAVNTFGNNDILSSVAISRFNPETNISSIIAVTDNTITTAARKLIGHLNSLDIDIKDPKFQENLRVKSITTKQKQVSNDVADFMKPLLGAKVIGAIKKIVKESSVVVHPIVSRGRVIGNITYLLKDKKYEDLEDNQKQLVDTYTLQIAIALENANLFEVTEKTQKNLKQALDELQEVRRQERDMIDIMGHELRTPITIVRNALLVMDGLFKATGTIPAETLKKYLEMSVESVRREIALIETLLSATKVDAKRLQISQEKVDMVDVINDSLEAFSGIAEEKHLKIVYDKPEKEIYGYADRVRIQEVMDNLLSNAVKYTLNGDVGIEIEETGEFVKISVRDSGIGISKEDLPHIGKKFFRAKQYINDEGEEMVVRPGGTGLGLYVVFELVKIMGGEITIESKVGEGSTFSFTVPKFTGQKEIKYQDTGSNNKKVGVLKFDRKENNPKPEIEVIEQSEKKETKT